MALFFKCQTRKSFLQFPISGIPGRRKKQIQKTNEMEPGRRRKKKTDEIELKSLTSEHHFTPSMYELKSACVVVSKNRTGVVVALAEFVTVENKALSISTKTNPAIAFSCVETFFIGQKTSCDLLNQ